MTPRETTNYDWMLEAVKAHGGKLDFDTLARFMDWLKDNEGKYFKEEFRAFFKQFLDSNLERLPRSANTR